MKTIEIKISEMGEITIEADGYRDNSCLKAMEDFEKLFGEVKEAKLKQEAHRIPMKSNRVKT